MVGLDTIWKVIGVSGSDLDSSPSDSLLAVLPLEFKSVLISSSSSMLEVSESVVLESTPLASRHCCFFNSNSAIL